MRRHDLDLFSLVAGVLTLVAAVVLALSAYVDIRIDGRIVWSAVLAIVGVVGVTAGVVAIRRDAPAEPAALDD